MFPAQSLRRLAIVIAMSVTITTPLPAQPNFPTEPAEAQLVTVDLVTFVGALNHPATAGDPVAHWQAAYLDRASPGLKEFISRHRLNAAMLHDAVRADPARYAEVGPFLGNLDTFSARYTAWLHTYKRVVPQAVFPPTYLLIGANRGIAQASRVGQLVTVERALKRPEVLHRMCLHELSHFQQVMAMGFQKYVGLYQQPDNMLGLVLREGVAEFVTHLVTGEITQPKTLAHLIEHEAELKARFTADLAKQDSSYWMWDSLEDKDRPILLGYALGFRICQRYYEKAADKSEALKTLLAMPDAPALLKESGYLPEAK